MVFPAAVAGFHRVDIAHFSARQPDVAVGYDLTQPDSTVAATVYLRPAPSLLTVGMSPDAVAAERDRSCHREFDARKRDIAYFDVATNVRQRRVSIRENDLLRSGDLAVFTHQANFAGRHQRVRTELYRFCFAGGNWTLEFLFTYPAGVDPQDSIANFMHELAWTGQLAS